ncbi:post-PEP-CTERM-1 domain-containing protein [Massilia agri]|uniref:DUF2782 domain-containing protein n=1 Tax=Massilia agri TaxID=1886785 RepID=A0ABT2AKU8_9BURK|nr:hypothetical protein [Massilia agri]MCS0596791.1 hypothetical protein [Massilia agri]
MPTHTPKFLLPLAILCLPAAAQQATQEATPEARQPAAPQAGAPSGMVVVRDAQTGQLRTPAPAEMRALQPRTPSTALAPSQPKMVTGPGGRRSVQLGERHMVYSVVTRGADGKLSDQCVHGVHAAENAVDHPAPASKPEEHRHDR